MTLNLSVTELAYYCASLISLVFAVTVSLRRKKISAGVSFCLAAYVNTLWLFLIAYMNPVDIEHTHITTHDGSSFEINNLAWLLVIEIIRYSAWVLAFIKTTQRACTNCVPKKLRYSAYILGICLPIAAVVVANSTIIELYGLKIVAWSGILFSIFSLVILEQLYRNMPHDRLMRLIWLALALNYFFDAFLFSQNLVVMNLSSTLWQVRASIMLVTLVFISIGVLTLQSTKRRARIAISQPAIFYTTSLTISGLVLLFLAVVGYYVRLIESSWSIVFYSTLLTIGVISILFTFSSAKLRRKLNVALNKHLFNYKYDYRSEWLKLIRLLSQPGDHEHYSNRALSASADLFRCDEGGLWQKKGSSYFLTAEINKLAEGTHREEPTTTEFANKLKEGWIFSPNAADHEMAKNNEFLPKWVQAIPDIWLIFPLVVENDVTGFMVLSEPQEKDVPNWEDLDLVKTVGRQIANHLARHEQSELLAQARQFETFNKLSAFVMHDLKNLIAQQSLVVKNAEKHKDNPAFVDDAINTINNSVERMNNLLRKLRQNEPEETKVLQLKSLLIEAVKRCQKTPPAPTLLNVDDNLHVKADFDSLVMVFTHLVHNAQDATPSSGYIDIYAEREEAFVVVFIEDNGEGMDDKFIRDKLFQPFESTKSGKGMGVGVYQAREYIENLGGEVTVESNVGQGTKFTLKIPLANA